ncbi:MAG TPA: hypothetical protein VGV67_09885 [Solirubrobacteraceae bacterium]|nr:hypothetical protein [Solirubrobacteraceae bacterium]
MQLAISCVSPSVLQVAGGYAPSAQPHALVLGDGDFQPLRGESKLSLSVGQQYRIVEADDARGPWKVQTVAYAYVLQADDQELIAFHWNPTGAGSVTRPHLHLGPAAGCAYPALARAHVPTGRIALEDVLRLAIEEFGVEPLRDDWSELLETTQSGYEEWRTWSGSSGAR